jgi:hypothetical protein
VTCGLQRRDLAFVLYIADRGRFGGQTSKAGSDAVSCGFRNVAAKGAENPNLILLKLFPGQSSFQPCFEVAFWMPWFKKCEMEVGRTPGSGTENWEGIKTDGGRILYHGTKKH